LLYEILWNNDRWTALNLEGVNHWLQGLFTVIGLE